MSTPVRHYLHCRFVGAAILLTDVAWTAPHVGHLYTMVLADILKRWRVLLGEEDAQLLTGTDEHGMKVWRSTDMAICVGFDNALDPTSCSRSGNGYSSFLR